MRQTPACDTVIARMHRHVDRPAVIWRGNTLTYGQFLDCVERWDSRLHAHGIGAGAVCAIYGDFSAETCALLFALIRRAAVAVPFTSAVQQEISDLKRIAGVRWMISVDRSDAARIEEESAEDNKLIAAFRQNERPGLVVFTSGSTGKPKGILHDCERVLDKFVPERPGWRTLLFLMMDHFGGYNTFLSAFAYGGTAVCVDERSPESVCRIIESTRANLLPTTPSFLRLLSLSGAWRRFDLSSIELITYGAEPMPQSTLERIRTVFPRTKLKQTYGLSELGVLRSQSPNEGSTWLKIGGAGFETRVIDGMLWIRSSSSMVGYINAPSPFDSEGWMNTGDQVEVKDGLIRFLGRKSDIINVGGQKVFPAEVEDVLLAADNVCDATVYGVVHPLLGEVPCARITIERDESDDALSSRLRRHCAKHLAKYKIPMRFIVDGRTQIGQRHKKQRERN